MRPYKIVSFIFTLLVIAFAAFHRSQQLSAWWLVGVIFIYLSCLVLGAIYIQWNFYLPSFNKGNNNKFISLTFDDGPFAETAAVLDILKQQNVPAVFFSIGKNAAQFPELVLRWHNEGHLIGNHSYNHGFNFDWQNAKTMQAEMEQANAEIKRITGVIPLLFRPPYGVTNPNLAKAVQHTKMYSVGWNVRSFDTTAKNGADLLERILSRLKGGDIILLHDKVPLTKEILTDLIVKAREKGFTFVRVDQLLDIPAYA